MAAPKVSKKQVSQTINLRDEFGVSFRGKDSLKQAIGQALIDKMLARISKGGGMNFGSGGRGTPFNLNGVPYSKSYKKSLGFKAEGKKTSPVNMELTGDMLGTMDVVKVEGNKITIGWDSGDNENLKAFNHIKGDTLPKRPFFGLNKKEISDTGRQFKSEVKEAFKVKADEGAKAFNEFVLGLVRKIKDGND